MLTLDQLKRRGRLFAIRCFLCEEEEESIDHLEFIVDVLGCFGIFFGYFLFQLDFP